MTIVAASSNNPEEKKAAVCIKEMAGMVGLSRQRFGQLVKSGIFPAPLVDEATKRPYYPEDLQQTCLEVRRRNCGINGKVVMFYARRSPSPAPSPKVKKPTAPADYLPCDAEILEGVKGLGLTTATLAQVAGARKERFPDGVKVVDTKVVTDVFLHLRGKNPGGNVGRK